MEQPNYIFRFNEASLIKKETGGLQGSLKKAVIVIVGILIVGSILLGGNLFKELSWMASILLIVLIGGVMFSGNKKEYIPSPVEIQFFDDYLLVYRKRFYYSRKVSRMEYNKMMYSNITKCVLETKSQMLFIYGDVEAKWYDYDKNGNVPSVPTYNRLVKEAFCYMNIRLSSEMDYVREIECHSPIKVSVENK